MGRLPFLPFTGSQDVEAACLAVGVTVEAHYLNDTLPDYHNGLITYHEADILGWRRFSARWRRRWWGRDA